MRPIRNQRGFTLISVLIAVVILAIGLSALARTQALLVATQTNVNYRSVALSIAESNIERLRSTDPWTIVAEPPTEVTERGIPVPGSPFIRSSTVAVIGPNLIQLDVSVAYPRGTNAIQLGTLIYRSGP